MYTDVGRNFSEISLIVGFPSSRVSREDFIAVEACRDQAAGASDVAFREALACVVASVD
jgi:hypothetical protein